MFSYYQNPLFISNNDIDITNNITFQDWINENKMNIVLSELSKSVPKTRILYNKYLLKKIGRPYQNKLNKYDIINHYLQLTKSDYIIGIIYNYEKNSKLISDNYIIRNNTDKQIIIYILNYYLKNTKNNNIYNELINIINIITKDESEINTTNICKLILRKNIQSYHLYIIDNIINFRKFENKI